MEKITSLAFWALVVAIIFFSIISYSSVVIKLESIAKCKTIKNIFNMVVFTAIAVVSFKGDAHRTFVFLLCMFLVNLIMQKRALNQLYANIISFLVDFPLGKFSCEEKNEKGQYWGELEVEGHKMQAVAVGDAFEGAEEVPVMIFVQLNNEGNPMMLQVMPLIDEEQVTLE